MSSKGSSRTYPCKENPDTDKPDTKKPTQLNTNELNTHESNTESIHPIYPDERKVDRQVDTALDWIYLDWKTQYR